MLILKPLTIERLVIGARIYQISFSLRKEASHTKLAHVLNSLVRVSRRAECISLAIIFMLWTPRYQHNKKQGDSQAKSAPKRSFAQEQIVMFRLFL